MKRILYFLQELWLAVDPVGKVALTLFAILMIMLAMLPVSSTTAQAQSDPQGTPLPQSGMWVTEYDGCEYIVYNGYTSHGWFSRYMTHKGNCKYCQERLKKLLKDYQ